MLVLKGSWLFVLKIGRCANYCANYLVSRAGQPPPYQVVVTWPRPLWPRHPSPVSRPPESHPLPHSPPAHGLLSRRCRARVGSCTHPSCRGLLRWRDAPSGHFSGWDGLPFGTHGRRPFRSSRHLLLRERAATRRPPRRRAGTRPAVPPFLRVRSPSKCPPTHGASTAVASGGVLRPPGLQGPIVKSAALFALIAHVANIWPWRRALSLGSVSRPSSPDSPAT